MTKRPAEEELVNPRHKWIIPPEILKNTDFDWDEDTVTVRMRWRSKTLWETERTRLPARPEEVTDFVIRCDGVAVELLSLYVTTFPHITWFMQANRNDPGDFYCQWSQLKRIVLMETTITSLPDAISQLSSLEELGLFWNEELVHLPSALTQCSRLRKLELRKGEERRDKFPHVISNLTTLVVLEVSGYSLTDWPDFGNLSKLEKLRLEIKLPKYTIVLPPSLSKLNNIRRITFTCPSMNLYYGHLEEGWKDPILSTYQDLLGRFDLGGFHFPIVLGGDGARTFFNLFSDLPMPKFTRKFHWTFLYNSALAKLVHCSKYGVKPHIYTDETLNCIYFREVTVLLYILQLRQYQLSGSNTFESKFLPLEVLPKILNVLLPILYLKDEDFLLTYEKENIEREKQYTG